MTRKWKSKKSSTRKDLLTSEEKEIEELKTDLTDSLESGSSSNSSFVATSGGGIVFPIASNFSHGLVSRALSSSAPSSPTRDRSFRDSCGKEPCSLI